MITIYIDNKKIYDPRIRKLQLEEAELSQAKNKAGTLKMILPADHAYSDLLRGRADRNHGYCAVA